MNPGPTPQRNQSNAPPGFDSQRLCIIELGPEIAAMEGFGLRLSRVTVQPGAVFASHSHAGQPEIIYVVEGRLGEQRNDDPWIDHGPGSVLVLTHDITHALANRTEQPTIYMSTSVKR